MGADGLGLMTHHRSHQWIDERSLALARATAEKLRRDAALFAVAQANLQRWKATLSPWPGALKEWEECIASGKEAVIALLTEDSPRGRRLRQSSPFVGVLTVAERNAIFRRYESHTA